MMNINEMLCHKCLQKLKAKAVGQTLYVRKTESVNPDALRKMRKAGMTVSEIARTVNLTPRRVWQLFEKM